MALLTVCIFSVHVCVCMGGIGPSQPSSLDTGCLPDLGLGSLPGLASPSSHPVSALSMGDTDTTSMVTMVA